MEKIILTTFFLVGLFFSAGAGNFRISGEVEIGNGEMVLCVDRVTGRDTLACVPIRDGKFEMSGTIDCPEVATIGVKGYAGGFLFFLDDDRPFQMRLRNGASEIEGGHLQTAYTDYLQLVEKLNGEIGAVRKEQQAAAEARKFRTASELNTKLQQLLADSHKQLETVLSEHKDDLFGIYIACTMAAGSGKVEEMRVAYGKLSESARETEPARLLQSRIARLSVLQVGQSAPDFVLPERDGREVRLSELPGKIKLLDFWASWCGPCRLENPNMVALYRDFRDKGLTIVSVSLDTDRAKWLAAIGKDGLTWTQVSSLKGWKCEVVERYNVHEVPYIWVLDENNRILATQLRGEQLRAFVTERLGDNK